MPEYVYRGRDRDSEYCFGVLESSNVCEAIQLLKGRNMAVIITVKDRRRVPRYWERLERFKCSVISGWGRIAEKVSAGVKAVGRQRNQSKVLSLLHKLNQVDISLVHGFVVRGDEDIQSAGEDPVAVDVRNLTEQLERPEFKKRPVRRRGSMDGFAIAWDMIKGPTDGEVRRMRLSFKDIQFFTCRLALLLSSGVALASALKTLEEHAGNVRMRKMIHSIRDDVQNGHPLSYALMRFPSQFSHLYVAMVAVGEASGTLEQCLLDMADFMDTQQKIRQSIKNASIYPRVVVGVLLAMLILGSRFFIPMFKGLFFDFGMSLPFLTRAIFWVADSLVFILPAVALVFLALYLLLRYVKPLGEEYLYRRDGLLLRVPVVKDMLLSISMFHFSHTISVMLRNGVRLVDALLMARDVVPNKVLQYEVHDALEQVVGGVDLSEALFVQRNFDPLVASMIQTGEESGALDKAFTQTSEHYLVRVNDQVSMFVQWVQPASILLLAAVVVPVVLGIFLPLLDLMSGSFIN